MVTRSPRRYSRTLLTPRIRSTRGQRQVMSPTAVIPGTALRRPIGAISIRNRRSRTSTGAQREYDGKDQVWQHDTRMLNPRVIAFRLQHSSRMSRPAVLGIPDDGRYL